MTKTTYKPIVESEFKVSSVYSISIDKCVKFKNGEEKSEQVAIRYKKNGQKVPSVTEAIIEAYKQGVFSRESLALFKEGN